MDITKNIYYIFGQSLRAKCLEMLNHVTVKDVWIFNAPIKFSYQWL